MLRVAGLHQPVRPADLLRRAPGVAAPQRRARHAAAGVRARRAALRHAQRLHPGVRLRAPQLR